MGERMEFGPGRQTWRAVLLGPLLPGLFLAWAAGGGLSAGPALAPALGPALGIGADPFVEAKTGTVGGGSGAKAAPRPEETREPSRQEAKGEAGSPLLFGVEKLRGKSRPPAPAGTARLAGALKSAKPLGVPGAEGGGGAGAGADPCANCPVLPVACDTVAAGELQAGDCALDDGSFVDVFSLDLPEAAVLSLRLRSESFDTFLFLTGSACEILVANDDCEPGNFDLSCIEATVGAGRHFLVVNSFGPGEVGAYSLEVDCLPSCEDCIAGTVACGEPAAGSLSATDCTHDAGRFQDVYTLELAEGNRVAVSVSAPGFEAAVEILDTACAPVRVSACEPGAPSPCLAAELPAGSYRVRVTSAAANGTGDYTLMVGCEAFSLCTDCVVGSITCGETVTEPFTRTGCERPEGPNVDLYSLSLAESGPVSVELGSDVFDTFVLLYDARCQVIAQNDDCNAGTLDSCINLDLEAGEYFIGVSSFDTGEGGIHDLKVSCPDISFCRDCATGALACGQTASGSLADGDCTLEDGRLVEVWRIEVPGGSGLEVLVSSKELEVEVSLLSPGCEIVATGGECADGEADACVLARQIGEGAHFIQVASRAPGGTGAYEIEARCAPYDPCTSCSEADIACGGIRMGALDGSDCVLGDGTFFDVYPFHLDVGQEVSINLVSPDFDTFIFLIDNGCLALLTNDDCPAGVTTDSCLTVDLPPGDYFAVANSFAPAAGSYTLSVECADIRTCTDCSVGSASCNLPIAGSLPASGCLLGDGTSLDIFELVLPAEGLVDISLESEDFDTFLFLYDETCIAFAANDDCAAGTLNSCLSLTLPAGTYHLGVNSFAAGESGDYVLEVMTLGCEVCSTCAIGAVACGETAAGSFPGGSCSLAGGGPVDLRSFTVPVEQEITIELSSAEFDPKLTVLDGACQVLAENDDCDANTLDSCLTLTLAAGSYFLGVESVLPGASGAYELRVEGTKCMGGLRLPADCSGDGVLNITDGICLLNMLFLQGRTQFTCGERGYLELPLPDFDGVLGVNLNDGLGVFNYLFLNGPPHILGTECVAVIDCTTSCAE